MSGARRGAAVLGAPIAHSLSPVLHRAAYDALGLAGWTYRAVECREPELGDVLRSLEAEGLAGASLTMPLKRAVLPMLARSDRVVADVGAANTVLFGGITGEWWGANTDVPGMVEVLREQGVSRPRSFVVVGGGATAASAVAAAAALGAAQVTVVARRPAATADVVAVGERLAVAVDVVPWPGADGPGADGPGADGPGADGPGADLLRADVVVSTVPAGAADALAELVPGAAGAPRGLLFDVVYAPWPTPLATAWAAGGGRVAGGLGLLVAQAVEQVRLMTGLAPPVAAMRAAGEAALAGR